MRYRIKNLHDATIRMMHAKNFNFPSLDKDHARNEAIMKRLFDDTMQGKIKGFYLVDNTDFKAYHRSPKKDGYIQLSAGFYKNGELYPTYDIQMKDSKDMIKEGYPSGFYAIID